MSRGPWAAVEVVRGGIQWVASCAVDRVIVAVGSRDAPSTVRLSFGPLEEPASLRTRSRQRLLLTMEQDWIVARAAEASAVFTAQLGSYSYRVLDRGERELLAYHWHPAGVSPVTYPHLHLSGRLPPLDLGPGEAPARLGGMHLPTGGAVTFADIVRLLIAEFGVVPRREDWERVLTEAAG